MTQSQLFFQNYSTTSTIIEGIHSYWDLPKSAEKNKQWGVICLHWNPLQQDSLWLPCANKFLHINLRESQTQLHGLKSQSEMHNSTQYIKNKRGCWRKDCAFCHLLSCGLLTMWGQIVETHKRTLVFRLGRDDKGTLRGAGKMQTAAQKTWLQFGAAKQDLRVWRWTLRVTNYGF